MTSPRRAVVALGSNLGGRESLLRVAVERLAVHMGLRPAARSRVYETAPVGPGAQGPYLNAAVSYDLPAGFSEASLLRACLAVERELERTRDVRWGARTLDLDVLWVEDTVLTTASLELPHPRLRGRAFALAPLLDVAPDASDPRDRVGYSKVLATLDRSGLSRESRWAERFDTEEIEHTADEGFIVRARDRADALAAAAEALGALIVDPGSVRALEARPLALDPPEGTSVESPWADDDRFFAWLSEVLYAIDAGRFALRRAAIFDDGGPTGERPLRGVLWGEPLDEGRHAVRSAIKAITYHAMETGPVEEGTVYRAQVVVDV